MIDLKKLIKNSSAYKTVLADKQNGRLSHAYLIVVNDQVFLKDYVKIFAKLIMCDEKEFCESCRDCDLIEKLAHPDVHVYPEKNSILTCV